MKLSETRTLWFSFVLMMVIALAFQIISQQFGLTLLDGIVDPGEARELLATISDSHRTLHLWVTTTLDVAYPAAYGAFFAGTALRFFPRLGIWLMAPVAALVAIDLLEGIVQVVALLEFKDWLNTKAVLTSTKFLLVNYCLLLTLSAWLIWVFSEVKRFFP
jgi:hypothetical protein